MKTIPDFLTSAAASMRRLYLAPVRLYRRFLSPLKPVPTCRFSPTCSQYALDAVAEWGILIGTALALWRVVRCNPFSRGGEDPVPTRAETAKRLKSIWSKLRKQP